MSRQDRLELRQLREDLELIRREIRMGRAFDYQDRAARVQRAQKLLNEAAGLGDRKVHRLAAQVFWDAVESAYPAGFSESFERLKQGDPRGMDDAVRFLQADPWFFPLGLHKGRPPALHQSVRPTGTLPTSAAQRPARRR